jgi:hypothetical protein
VCVDSVVIVFPWSSASIFLRLSYDVKVANVDNGPTYEMFILRKFCFLHSFNCLSSGG